MCGIGGIVSNRQSGDRLRRLADAMKLRGPDGDGFFEENNTQYVGLAHKRLAIIDIETGKQPLSNETGDVWVILNGEIFNHRELRIELETKGHKFQTKGSDTEVLVHLWEEIGPELVNRLRGMFAFAIYDQRKKKVFLARDRLGIKPLYYSHQQEEFTFASTLDAIKASGLNTDLDPRSISNYLSLQFCPAPSTIYSNVFKLPAAHFLTFDLASGHIVQEKYWNPPLGECRKPDSDETERLHELLKDSVNSWSLSDVPVACSLSGGLDSSAIASMMSSDRGKIPAYTLRVRGASPEQDEFPLASLVAKKFGLEHRSVEVDEDHLLDSLDEMMESLDEPYAGGLPSWFIYKAMHRDGIKVCLSGTGGDELFGNYGKFLPFEKLKLASAIRLLRNHKHNPQRLLRIYSTNTPSSLYPLYLRSLDKENLFQSSIFHTESWVDKMWRECPFPSHRDRVASFDLANQLPEEFLFVTDRFSMANSVEARTPFLDHHFVQRVLSLDSKFRTSAPHPKWLLKKVISERVPAEILQAHKRGFTLPIENWLKGKLKSKLLHFLDPKRLRRLGYHEDANRLILSWAESNDLSVVYKAWTWLLLQLWMEKKKITI